MNQPQPSLTELIAQVVVAIGRQYAQEHLGSYGSQPRLPDVPIPPPPTAASTMSELVIPESKMSDPTRAAGNLRDDVGTDTQPLESGLDAFDDVFGQPESAPLPGGPTQHLRAELTTRNFYESLDLGGYFFSLQVDNLNSVGVYISGCGHYDLTREPYEVDLAVIDDEDEPVPVVLRRVVRRKGWTTIAIQVMPAPPQGLRTISPWAKVRFK